jgi:predicted DNA-binding transcriptional regulator YafY
LRATGLYLPYFELTQAGSNEPLPYPGLRRVSLSETELQAPQRATRRLVELQDSPFAAAASAARRKLAFDLPLDADTVETVIAPPLPQDGSESLAVLQEAVATHTAVNCRYFAISRDADEERAIEPYGIYFQWGHWYCVARARDRNAMRVFRADRMRNASLLKNDTFTVPGDFDIRRYLGRAPWEMGEGAATTARVRFAFPVSRWVENQRAGRAVEPASEDGSAVLEFDVRDRARFSAGSSPRQDASLLSPHRWRGNWWTCGRASPPSPMTGEA